MAWVVTPEQFLNLEQVKKLRALAQSKAEEARRSGRWHGIRDYMMLELALGSGLRASELASLQVGDIILDPANPTVVVRRGKGGKMRIVKVGDALIQHLREYLKYREAAGRGNSPWLLPGQRGKWTRHGVGRVFKLLARQAGLPGRFSIHSLRHTFATMLLKVSKSLRLVQKALGHSSPVTTAVYADVIDTDALKAANQLYEDIAS